MMTRKAAFGHAGCAALNGAEPQITQAPDPARYAVELVHPGTDPFGSPGAEAAGIVPVPAPTIGGAPLQINSGAALAEVKSAA